MRTKPFSDVTLKGKTCFTRSIIIGKLASVVLQGKVVWQLVQPRCIFYHMFLLHMKGILRTKPILFFVGVWFGSCRALASESGPGRLKPLACSPHSLCCPDPLAPPCPPAPCRGAPLLHPGSLPQGFFSSSLHLLLLHLHLAHSLLPLHRRPPRHPPCPGWLSQCRWMTRRRAYVVAQPGWGLGGWSLWWRTQRQDLRDSTRKQVTSDFVFKKYVMWCLVFYFTL